MLVFISLRSHQILSLHSDIFMDYRIYCLHEENKWPLVLQAAQRLNEQQQWPRIDVERSSIIAPSLTVKHMSACVTPSSYSSPSLVGSGFSSVCWLWWIYIWIKESCETPHAARTIYLDSWGWVIKVFLSWHKERKTLSLEVYDVIVLRNCLTFVQIHVLLNSHWN